MFKRIFPIVLSFEGGYVNHPNDKGGATNKGITQATYDRFRDSIPAPRRPVREILFQEVEEIYKSYWTGAACDKFYTTHPLTAGVHFDASINSGNKQAIRFLQRASDAKPIDGIFGRITHGAVNKTSDLQLSIRYLDIRQDFYFDLVDKDPSQYVFLRGWIRRLNHLRRFVYVWAGTGKEQNTSSSSA